MLRFLRNKLSGGPIYIRVTRSRLRVIAVTTGNAFDDEPLIAISDGEQKSILAIGAPARSSGGTIVNPFDHPRLFVHQFQVLEKLLQHAFAVALARRFIQSAPVVVWQVEEALDGGLTDIEKRVLREAALGAGAYEVFIHVGNSLSNQQVIDGMYAQHAI